MTPATDNRDDNPLTEKTIARIDAQDVHSVDSVRDFLVSFGCDVIINRSSGAPVDYHIICGDSSFVKQIFSDVSTEARKRLVMLFDSEDGEALEIPMQTKTVLLDPQALTSEEIEGIFHFFFTSRRTELDLRKNPKKHRPPESIDLPKQSAHVRQERVGKPDEGESDRQRINDIIHSIFSPPKKDKKLSKQKQKRLVSTLLVLLLLSPFLWYSISISFGTLSLISAAAFLRGGNMEFASRAGSAAGFWSDQAESTLGIIGKPIAVVSPESVYRQERYVSLLSYLAEATKGVSKIFASGRALAGQLLSRIGSVGEPRAPAREVEKLTTELFSVQNNLGLAQSELHELIETSSFPFWLPMVTQMGTAGETILARYRHIIASVDKFLVLYPRLGGFREKQVYLLLLQNSMELRPTGGFIGSIALVTTQDGSLVDLQIQDVYTVDGQLRGHVDPPLPIREIIGQEHWYLRDSNWDVDFPSAAARAAWFYEKETGIRVDGVIAISTPFIVNLLSVTGPLTLVDYNDRITSQNFYGKSLFYTQADFFPGSTQKKDFLGSLTRTLIDQLTTSRSLNAVNVFRAFTSALGGRDLMIYFRDPELQGTITQFGWSGNVYSLPGCAGAGTSCLFDPLMVVEANLGVNKANYFVTRRLARSVKIEQDGGVRESVTVSFANASEGQVAVSEGVYRSYVRFVIPLDATIEEVRLNGSAIPFRDTKSKNPPAMPYAEYSDKPGILGVALEIPPGGNAQLSVEYRPTAKLQFTQEGATYELFVQKQAGLSDTPADIAIEFPVFWEANMVNTQEGEQFLAKEGRLEYNTTLSKDVVIRFQFVK